MRSSWATSLTRRVTSALGYLLGLQRKGDVFAHRHVRIERKELEDEGNVPLAWMAPGHIFAIDQDSATRDSLQTGDHAQGRRLAAAGWAQQHHKLAVLDGQVHRLDGVDLPELFRHLLQFNLSHLRASASIDSPIVELHQRLRRAADTCAARRSR